MGKVEPTLRFRIFPTLLRRRMARRMPEPGDALLRQAPDSRRAEEQAGVGRGARRPTRRYHMMGPGTHRQNIAITASAQTQQHHGAGSFRANWMRRITKTRL